MREGWSLGRWLGRMLACVCVGVLTASCAGNISPETYRAIASNLVKSGHLRTERAPRDAVFDAKDLVRNFRDIAFSYEFHFRDGEIVNAPIDKPLNRWRGTIRYRLIGDGVTPADLDAVRNLTDELAVLTGLRFERSVGAHDMLISIASNDGRGDVADFLAERRQYEYRDRYQTWRRTPGWLCGATLSLDRSAPGVLVYAHIFLGAELGPLMRTSCLHEEIIQSLGLTNDSDQARPSIFNDNQEFALMTDHDALLLRLLYDDRLRPGMLKADAMPIVAEIGASLIAGGSPVQFARLRRGRRPRPDVDLPD